jgi:hypothetical protein
LDINEENLTVKKVQIEKYCMLSWLDPSGASKSMDQKNKNQDKTGIATSNTRFVQSVAHTATTSCHVNFVKRFAIYISLAQVRSQSFLAFWRECPKPNSFILVTLKSTVLFFARSRSRSENYRNRSLITNNIVPPTHSHIHHHYHKNVKRTMK